MPRPAPSLDLVVIDPGHGGNRAMGSSTPQGVRGPTGTLEKDVTLALARRVAAHLGPRAALTRADDRNVPLAARAQLASQKGARVFLSLHTNGGRRDKRGAEAFIHGRAPDASRALATSLQRRLAPFPGAPGYIARGDFAVLRPERLPRGAAACLLEVDYLSHRDGEKRLRDPRALDVLAKAIARGVDDYLRAPRRYGDGLPGDPPPTRPADAGMLAEALLRYLRPYFDRLSDEAKQRLVQAWRESPGAVIAAGTLLGADGIAFLVGTNSPLPPVPAIPLDFLGDAFRGAELKLQVNGPVTSPTSFQFSVVFHERRPPSRRADRPPSGEVIDDLLPAGNKPEDIATRVDGPEFETEVPDQGPGSDIALYLAEFIRTLANALLREVARDPARPWIDLGQLPPLPGDFGRGLTRIIDALVDALPDRFGSIEQVSFITHDGNNTRWIPVIPTARRAVSDGQRYGDADAGSRCALDVTYPTALPDRLNQTSTFRMGTNHSSGPSRVLLRNDTVVFELQNVGTGNTHARIVITDDEGNGQLCEAGVDLSGNETRYYVQFSRFGQRAGGTDPRTTCQYEITLTNLDNQNEGAEMYVAIYV